MASVFKNDVGTLDDPLNIEIMDVPSFIADHRALPVSSALVFEPSTNMFHEDGLYSEKIFGSLGSVDRMERFGFIELNTKIYSPKIFKVICQLKSLYKDIMSGAAYAVFDPIKKDFERVTGDPTTTASADTGYSFFMHHFPDLVFHKTESDKRDERITLVEKYKDISIYTRYLVEPAGLRDLKNDSSGRLIQDDINKLYAALLMLTRAIPRGSMSVLYDPVRYQIQCKAQEIYNYIEDFLDGKHGFIQGSFARRKVAMGTRNVITASPGHGSSPEDPQLLKADDVQVGVYQTVKGLVPFAKNIFWSTFGNPILKAEAVSRIALTDPDSHELVYTSIPASERDAWMTSDGLEKRINSLRNPGIRKQPVWIKDTEGKKYALCLVYDDNDEIAIVRSFKDLEKRWPRKVDRKKLRPITYIEMFYIIAEIISIGKHGLVTRYPVIQQGSSYPAKIHVVSTTPARKVDLIDLVSGYGVSTPLRQYPIMGASYMDAMMVHPSRLAGMGADHDGDKCSLEFVWGEDSNRECADYLNSIRSVINTDLRFVKGGSTYLIDQMIYAMTKD